MSPLSWLWLVLGLVVIVVAHELTHIAIARAHGHRLICVGLNPIGAAVVFEDTPHSRYWLLQTALPAVTTWVLTALWLFGLFGLFGPDLSLPVPPPPAWLWPGVTLLSVLTSGGDIAGCVFEHRRPVWGEARIARDFAMLRKVPTLVVFTEYGRRWKPLWEQLGQAKPAGAGA